jgi:hypothetical protein
MKTLVFIIACGFTSCSEFNPTPEQIDATAALVRVVVLDLDSGK